MNTIKTLELTNFSFVIPATFSEFCKQDDQAAISLADAVLAELGGSRLMPEVSFILDVVQRVACGEFDGLDLPYTWEDVTNYEPTANAEVNGTWEDITEEKRDQLVSDLEGNRFIGSPDCTTDQAIETLNYLEFDQYPEIYQWFSLDDLLLRHLEELGECVLDDRYWGRTTFGQSVTLDYNFQVACFNIAQAWAK